MLAKVFNQDVYNMPRVQAGLKASTSCWRSGLRSRNES